MACKDWLLFLTCLVSCSPLEICVSCVSCSAVVSILWAGVGRCLSVVSVALEETFVLFVCVCVCVFYLELCAALDAESLSPPHQFSFHTNQCACKYTPAMS